MELFRISRDVYINLDETEAVIRNTVIDKSGTEQIIGYSIHLTSGKEHSITSPILLDQINNTLIAGETDDVFTPEAPRTVVQKLLSMFRR